MFKKCTPLCISTSKRSKHSRFGALLEVEIKNCTALWREAHIDVGENTGPLLDVYDTTTTTTTTVTSATATTTSTLQLQLQYITRHDSTLH